MFTHKLYCTHLKFTAQFHDHKWPKASVEKQVSIDINSGRAPKIYLLPSDKVQNYWWKMRQFPRLPLAQLLLWGDALVLRTWGPLAAETPANAVLPGRCLLEGLYSIHSQRIFSPCC